MALNPYPVEHDLKRELKRQELKADATDFNCFQDLSPEILTDLLNEMEKAERELKLKLATMSEEERSTRDQWYRVTQGVPCFLLITDLCLQPIQYTNRSVTHPKKQGTCVQVIPVKRVDFLRLHVPIELLSRLDSQRLDPV
jgi:hypothetical protein